MTTRTAQLRTRLRTDILSGMFPSGQKIGQQALASRYGVSRIPLREALTELQAEGLVRHVPNRGFFVTEMSTADMAEVYRLRELLEAEAISAACHNLSDAALERIAGLAEQVQAGLESEDTEATARANREFHFAVFDAAGMPRLSRILTSLWDATEAYRGLYFLDPDNHDHIVAEHATLLSALRHRDPDAAVAAQAEHRARSLAQVSSRLG